MIMGVGMGLTMSPMSTAAMNAVAPDKAGVASGILSMSRMVGGTFGVAAIGALFQTLSQAASTRTLAGLGLSPRSTTRSSDALGQRQAGESVQDPRPADQAQQVAAAMQRRLRPRARRLAEAVGRVAAAGAVLALALIESRKALAAAGGPATGHAEPTAPVAERPSPSMPDPALEAAGAPLP